MNNLNYTNIVDGKILQFILKLFKDKLETNILDLDYLTEELVKKIVTDAINNLIDGAPETFDTLKEIADYLKENGDILDSLLDTLKDKVDKKDAVIYTDTSNDNNPNRRSIILDNHSNILGRATDEGAYNIAMVSKWNVVDLGTTALPINLNGYESRPTYNDNKEIALLEDVQKVVANIPDILEEYVTLEKLGETLLDYISVTELNAAKMTEEEAREMISEIFKNTEND